MPKPVYRFLPNIALADIAFRAYADTASSLFEVCGRAVTEVMVDRRSLRGNVVRRLSMKADDLDGLLYDFLTQLIIMKDVDSLLFREVVVRVARDGRSLSCKLVGETIDRDRHRLRNDVKAVTMYMFGVRRGHGRSTVTVVLDI